MSRRIRPRGRYLMVFVAAVAAVTLVLPLLAAAQDTDLDGVDDPVDPCVNISGLTFNPRHRLHLLRINEPAQPDRLKFRGKIAFDFSTFDPETNAVQLVVRHAGQPGTEEGYITINVPAGPWDGTKGWKQVNPNSWRYYSDREAVNRTKAKVTRIANGNVKVGLDAHYAGNDFTPAGGLSPADLPLSASVVYAPAIYPTPPQWCADTAFSDPSYCRFNPPQTRLRCID